MNFSPYSIFLVADWLGCADIAQDESLLFICSPTDLVHPADGAAGDGQDAAGARSGRAERRLRPRSRLPESLREQLDEQVARRQRETRLHRLPGKYSKYENRIGQK